MAPTLRPVITGIGIISAAGATADETCAAVAEGRLPRAPIRTDEARGFGAGSGAGISGFDPRAHFANPKAVKLTDRTTQLAIAAAAMARTHCGWNGADDRLGVVIGSIGSDLQAAELGQALRSDDAPVPVDDIPTFANRVLHGLNPLWLLINLPNMPSAHVAIQFGAHGPNSSIMTDGAAGSQAVGEAADWIRTGEADAVLAGGSDTLLHPFALAACEQAGLFSGAQSASAFAPAEGAAVVMLESAERAHARGATVFGEVAGYASCSAADGRPVPALADTMRAAMREAGWSGDDVGAVAMASRAGDADRDDEEAALAAAVGAGHPARRINIEAAVGHCGAALGPMSLGVLLAGRWTTRGILCNAVGWSGAAVTLAVQPHHGRPE